MPTGCRCCSTFLQYNFFFRAMKSLPNDIFFAQVESEISLGRSVWFKVKGNSMYPFLSGDKDYILLSPVNEPVVKNDVVLFFYKGRHVLHRVIKIEGEKYIMQGDGVYASREFCHSKDIIGKVTQIQRPSGKIIPVTSFKWRMFSLLWVNLRFLRKYLLFIYRRLFL